MSANTQELGKDKWLCLLSGKKFMVSVCVCIDVGYIGGTGYAGPQHAKVLGAKGTGLVKQLELHRTNCVVPI